MLSWSEAFPMDKRLDLIRVKVSSEIPVTMVTKSEAHINSKQKQLADCLGIT
jgi:hypothetical protein